MREMGEDRAEAILIEREILVEHGAKNFGYGFNYVLSSEFREKFLEYVSERIEKRIKHHADYRFKAIINRLNLYPKEIRKSKILSEIEAIGSKLQPFVFDDDIKRSMILKFYNSIDYLSFANNNFTRIKFGARRNEDLKEFIDNEAWITVMQLLNKEYKRKSDQKTTSSKITYKWQGKPDKDLPELYNKMRDEYKLIAPETTLNQFKAIFTGQPIDSIEPIKWHDNTASELLYFIKRLRINLIESKKQNDYNQMIACFVLPDGEPFKANFRQLNTNIEINLSEDKQEAIDKLINEFL